MGQKKVEIKKLEIKNINEIPEEPFCLQQTIIKQIVAENEADTREVIRNYVMQNYPNNGVRIEFLKKEVIDKIIDLGMKEYIKIYEKEKADKEKSCRLLKTDNYK